MTSRNTRLAVLLRKAQWMLDDAAHAVGGGRLSSVEHEELSEALTELAKTLKEEIPLAEGESVTAEAAEQARHRSANTRSRMC